MLLILFGENRRAENESKVKAERAKGRKNQNESVEKGNKKFILCERRDEAKPFNHFSDEKMSERE